MSNMSEKELAGLVKKRPHLAADAGAPAQAPPAPAAGPT